MKKIISIVAAVFAFISGGGAGRDAFSAETQNNSTTPAKPGMETLRPPEKYSAPDDLKPRDLPPLPKIGPAGSSFTDPAFGSRMIRVTETGFASNPAGPKDQSFYTPSSSWQNTWNSNSTLFFFMAQSGFFVPCRFDPAKFTISKIPDPANPAENLVLKFRRDPNFSFKDPSLLYGMSMDLKLQEYNFTTNTYTTLLDLRALVPNVAGNETDGVSGSADDELVVAFNGPGQDRLITVLWFDKKTGNKHLLDLSNATIDGKPAGFPTGRGGAHHASIAKGGRYVNIINQGVGNMVWDTQAGTCTMLTKEQGAHGAGGYGRWINHGALPDGKGQGWLTRLFDPAGLAQPTPVLAETPHFWGDSHPSWNNALPDKAVPFATAVYDKNYKPGDAKLSPLVGEIIAVSTDGSNKLWRFAHHRSVMNSGTSLGGTMDFWSTPRGNVSQDGRYFLFDSNRENTLGKDPRGNFRKDVFIVEMK